MVDGSAIGNDVLVLGCCTFGEGNKRRMGPVEREQGPTTNACTCKGARTTRIEDIATESFMVARWTILYCVLLLLLLLDRNDEASLIGSIRNKDKAMNKYERFG